MIAPCEDPHMRTTHHVLRNMGVALATLAIGFLTARARASDDVPDGAPTDLAHELHATARGICLAHPVAQLMIPATRLRSVTSDPAHCPGTGSNPNMRYRASVQSFTFFGIPAGQYDVRCGGLEVNCR